MARFRCRAFYQQIEYEAEIIEIETDTEGNKYATVRFAGYGNEETVWLTDIVASHGDEAWKKQVKEGSAAEEVVEKQAAAAAADEEQLAAALAAKAALTPERKSEAGKAEEAAAQPKTNTNAVQVEIQSSQIQQLEEKINELYHENKVVILSGHVSDFKVN